MTDVGDIIKDNEFFWDIADTPKEGSEQPKKWECLKSVIDRGKLRGDEIINKTYAAYRQCELSEKGENTKKCLRKTCH